MLRRRQRGRPNAEYILIEPIEPRLYLTARMLMDIAQGKVSW